MEILELEQLIVSLIHQITGKSIDSNQLNLFGEQYDLTVGEMIYVVEEIEKKLDKPIASIFEKADFTIMSVNKLAQAISNTYR